MTRKPRVFDLVGIPFPIDHKLFSGDTNLINKVRQLNNYLEISSEYNELREALDIWIRSLDWSFEDLKHLVGISQMLPKALLSHIVITYAKAFTDSHGRTNLIKKVSEIFDDNEVHRHEELMFIRNNYSAHHGIKADSHQLFFFQSPETESVKLKTFSGTGGYRIDLGRSLDPNIVIFCVDKVSAYLIKETEKIAKNIEDNLTPKQIEHINSLLRTAAFENWKPIPSNPFEKRKDDKKKGKKRKKGT